MVPKDPHFTFVGSAPSLWRMLHYNLSSHSTVVRWGFAVLAMLSRELSWTKNPSAMGIDGCLILLQSWAIYRMLFLASSFLDPVLILDPISLMTFDIFNPLPPQYPSPSKQTFGAYDFSTMFSRPLSSGEDHVDHREHS
ncbi:hypothetical protein PVK06_024489 [Gossypium arboreum]|uniref:Serine/threonine-protein phosphatase 7 long form homolog n=1 Tax=Gossypium arboreum TaxID=29729 RepID=A0ABR0PDV8_GOSAR|nr:hypothetical protein PVK06_024489 [Gossypium arboreum]